MNIRFRALQHAAINKWRVAKINKPEESKQSGSWTPGDGKYMGSYYEDSFELINQTTSNRLFLDTAIAVVSRQKSIIRTQVVGMTGTIKEYISTGDYDVSIEFGIYAYDDAGKQLDVYPEDGVKVVRSFFDVNEALKVESKFLSLLDITQLVVTEISITQQTYSNVQKVNIKALSDSDYTIEYSK